MAKTEPRTLSGFMELLPNEQILFNQMKETIEDTYKKFGFLPLDTPIIELSEVLLAKAGGETEKQIYRFNKGDKDLSLRFDLTVPLSKYVAKNYGNLSFPFRRYQIGKVYRGERTQKGRFREFYQCDIDIIGDQHVQDLISARKHAKGIQDRLIRRIQHPVVAVNEAYPVSLSHIYSCVSSHAHTFVLLVHHSYSSIFSGIFVTYSSRFVRTAVVHQ